MIHWRKVNPALLYPPFYEAVMESFNKIPGHWYVTYGHRTIAEQQKLHQIWLAGGPKAAAPGMSAHNYGCAIDVVLDADPNTPGLQPTWNEKLVEWVRYYLHFLNHKTLRTGKSFGDGGHVEWRDWKTVKAVNQGTPV